MIDSHTHLVENTFINRESELLEMFSLNGGKALLNVGYTPESNLTALQQRKSFNHQFDVNIYSALGLHPTIFTPKSGESYNNITSFSKLKKSLDEYKNLVERNINEIHAIGETGLDYYHFARIPSLSVEEIEVAIEMQKHSFRTHLEVANKHNVPLTIHSRDAVENSTCTNNAIELFCEVGQGQLRASFHSFTGEVANAKELINLGVMLGFNAITTYKSAANVREILKITPLDQILLETDAPYLPTENARKTNSSAEGSPKDLLEIASIIAEIKDIKIEKLIEATSNNFNSYFLGK